MQNEISIIFPSVFNELSEPWDAEYEIAKNLGFNVFTFDETTLKIKNDLKNQIVIYRGWMISTEDYETLSKNINDKGGIMFISNIQFKKANTFSNWYNILNRYTMESHFIRDFSELDNYFKDGKSWFVKDDLKSLGGINSIANSKKEAIKIYDKIQKNRDYVLEDNGICLREIYEITDEERFFALNGKILGEHIDKDRLDLANKVASLLFKRLGLVFISIDIGRTNFKNILVEIGGFQVSDISKSGDLRKIEECYSILKEKITLLI